MSDIKSDPSYFIERANKFRYAVRYAFLHTDNPIFNCQWDIARIAKMVKEGSYKVEYFVCQVKQ